MDEGVGSSRRGIKVANEAVIAELAQPDGRQK